MAIAPGGNRVESFLDIACPDGTAPAAVEAAVAVARARAGGERVAIEHAGVAVEFSVTVGTPDPGAALAELWDAARALLVGRPAPPWNAAPPLEIVVAHDEEGWTYQLTDASLGRLPEAAAPARVGVPFDVADDLRRLHGNLYPFVAEWVTGLSREEVMALGGARFVENGRLVSQWPPRG